MKKIAIAIVLFCTLYSAYSLDYRQVIFGNNYQNMIEIDADAFFEQYPAVKENYTTGNKTGYAPPEPKSGPPNLEQQDYYHVYEQVIGENTFYRVLFNNERPVGDYDYENKKLTVADFLNWKKIYFTQYVFFKKSDTDLLQLGDGYEFGREYHGMDLSGYAYNGLEIIERNNKVIGIMEYSINRAANYCLWSDIVKLEEPKVPTISYVNWQSGFSGYNLSIHEIQISSIAPLIDSRRPFMYTIQNAFDGNPATSYVDIFSLNFSFGDTKEFTRYKIINGYASGDYYYQNNQISKIDISKNGTFQLKDTLEPQIISIAAIEDNSFYMTVEEITKGTKYNDTCLAEFDMYIEGLGWLFGGNLDDDALVTSLDEDNVVPSVNGYVFTVEDGTAEIVGYDGEATKLNIPSTVEYQGKTYTVTSIGDRAFGSQGLTSVTIPDSVTSIGSNAFFGCESLTSIIIPNSVISIGKYSFFGCGLTSIIIPSSVISIGEKAFSECNSLTEVTIYGNDASIGREAFSWCENLTSVTISSNVTSIGGTAFGYCQNLVSITIPDSVTYIGWDAFYSCYSLTSVIIPNSVTSISNSTFRECENLTSVIIPDSVTSIGEYSFLGCDSLTSITIPSSVTSIEWGAFPDDENENFTLSVFPGSYALAYAKANDIPYILIEGE